MCKCMINKVKQGYRAVWFLLNRQPTRHVAPVLTTKKSLTSWLLIHIRFNFRWEAESQVWYRNDCGTLPAGGASIIAAAAFKARLLVPSSAKRRCESWVCCHGNWLRQLGASCHVNDGCWLFEHQWTDGRRSGKRWRTVSMGVFSCLLIRSTFTPTSATQRRRLPRSKQRRSSVSFRGLLQTSIYSHSLHWFTIRLRLWIREWIIVWKRQTKKIVCGSKKWSLISCYGNLQILAAIF